MNFMNRLVWFFFLKRVSFWKLGNCSCIIYIYRVSAEGCCLCDFWQRFDDILCPYKKVWEELHEIYVKENEFNLGNLPQVKGKTQKFEVFPSTHTFSRYYHYIYIYLKTYMLYTTARASPHCSWSNWKPFMSSNQICFFFENYTAAIQ